MGASNHGGKATVHALQLCMYGYGPGWVCDRGTADKASFLQLVGHCHTMVVFVFVSLILVFTHTHVTKRSLDSYYTGMTNVSK